MLLQTDAAVRSDSVQLPTQ